MRVVLGSVASLLALAVSLGAGAARADVYSWTDEGGTVHFEDERPEGVEHPRRISSVPEPQAVAVAEAFPTIELFTTGDCEYGDRAREYFTSRGIPFTEYDAARDPVAVERMSRAGTTAIPSVIIGGKVVKGYSPAEYDAALGR